MHDRILHIISHTGQIEPRDDTLLHLRQIPAQISDRSDSLRHKDQPVAVPSVRHTSDIVRQRDQHTRPGTLIIRHGRMADIGRKKYLLLRLHSSRNQYLSISQASLRIHCALYHGMISAFRQRIKHLLRHTEARPRRIVRGNIRNQFRLPGQSMNIFLQFLQFHPLIHGQGVSDHMQVVPRKIDDPFPGLILNISFRDIPLIRNRPVKNLRAAGHLIYFQFTAVFLQDLQCLPDSVAGYAPADRKYPGGNVHHVLTVHAFLFSSITLCFSSLFSLPALSHNICYNYASSITASATLHPGLHIHCPISIYCFPV